MPYDLRFESWLPWRRKSGAIEWGPPAHITDGADGEDPIVALACPRADFTGAVTEFLIGLYSVALAPQDEADWRKLWDAPPAPAVIDAALRMLPNAFFLDGDGPRAFQDIDPLGDLEPGEIGELLIDAPGENTIKFNKDLFVKRGVAVKFGRPAAAMALITLQTYAPSGGQGHRTSMRGGGPMTTLVEPRSNISAEPFWRLIWANSETEDQITDRDGDSAREWRPADRFPWLAPTRTSNPKQSGAVTTPLDAEPAQAYFALPRRIRLDIQPERGVCALTGREDGATVTAYRAQNYGVNYEKWLHPLSPYYRDGEDWRALHPQPGGIGWRDWLGLVAGRREGDHRPAAAIAWFAERRARALKLKYFRIVAFGFDMDNMKARSWVQAEFPAYSAETLQQQTLFAERCAAGAQEAVAVLIRAVKQGLFDNPKEAPGDFSGVRNALWDATEADFFDLMKQIAENPDALDAAKVAEDFAKTIRKAALAIFDQHCPLDGFEHGKMRRPIAARYGLATTLSGYGKPGAEFYRALALTAPESTKARKSKEPA